MKPVVLIHYSEIGLKGGNRAFFERVLRDNLRRALSGTGYRKIHWLRGCFVIDPGESRSVFKALDKHGLNLKAAFITHSHFDHSGGATRLDREGSLIPTFPRAKYLVQRSSWEEAFSPSERALPSFGKGCEHLLTIEERGQLVLLDGGGGVHYCGAYWGWGFHEDGARSAQVVARRLGGDSL